MKKNSARLIPRGTDESRHLVERVQLAMDLASQLNVLRHSDVDGRNALLKEILGRSLPETTTIYPPFYCDYGLNLRLGDHVFVNQNCSFYDLGGITIGDRTMIGPGVTLCTAGHPVEPAARYDGITVSPINVGTNVSIGANATIAPGVTIGAGSVVAAGAVVATDVPPNSLVSSAGHIQRRDLGDATHDG